MSRRFLATAAVATALVVALASGHGLAEPGDVNADGRLGSEDARAILEAVVGTRELGAAEREAADVDRDGDVDVADAQLIEQMEARKIDRFPDRADTAGRASPATD